MMDNTRVSGYILAMQNELFLGAGLQYSFLKFEVLSMRNSDVHFYPTDRLCAARILGKHYT